MIKTNLQIFLILLFNFTFAYAGPLVVGHRGSYRGVENTSGAFIKGAQAGFQGLETDVRVTKDGKFILCHDESLERYGWNESIANQTLAELKKLTLTQTRGGVDYTDSICTLEEYLDICNLYNCFPVIEMKWSDGINNNDFTKIPALIETVVSKGLASKAVFLTSMKPCLEFIRKNYPDLQLQFLCYPENALANLSWCKENKCDVDIKTGFSEDVVNDYHKAGLKVNVWTINNASDYKMYTSYGCDMITTDYLIPGKMVESEKIK